MGQAPSAPTDEQAAELKATLVPALDRAAAAIARADVLLLTTGAGWSADSGLAVYKDIANIKAYHDRELTYHDLCEPHWLEDEPGLFHGFWGECFNDYRKATPHSGYQIVRKWRDRHFGQSNPVSDEMRQAHGGKAGAFFCHTSNVDAHSFTSFEREEVRECHGNSETWQCAGGKGCRGAKGDREPQQVPGGKRRWKAPAGFRFNIDAATMLAPAGPPAAPATGCDEGFAENWPTCQNCGGAARPSILMFSDGKWVDDIEQRERWAAWRRGLVELAAKRVADGFEPLRVVMLEVGAGGNVTTIRNLGETLLEELVECGGHPTLIRINPDLPLADSNGNQPHTISLQSYGLAAIKQIDARLTALLQNGQWKQADATPPTLATVPIEPAEEPFGAQKHQAATAAKKKAAEPPPAPSEAELAEIRKAFDTVDLNKSGRLDREEVKAAGQRLGRYLAASDVDEGMAEMDQNGDGTVDFDEFVSWWWRSGRLSALDKLEANWAAFSSRFDMVTSAALGSLGARGGGGSGGAATATAAVVGAADA